MLKLKLSSYAVTQDPAKPILFHLVDWAHTMTLHLSDFKFCEQVLTIFWSWISVMVDNTNIEMLTLKHLTNVDYSLASTADCTHAIKPHLSHCEMTLPVGAESIIL